MGFLTSPDKARAVLISMQDYERLLQSEGRAAAPIPFGPQGPLIYLKFLAYQYRGTIFRSTTSC